MLNLNVYTVVTYTPGNPAMTYEYVDVLAESAKEAVETAKSELLVCFAENTMFLAGINASRQH